MMNVIKHKWFFLGFSAVLVAASVYGIVAFGLKPGIDFTGGTLWQIEFQSTSSTPAVVAKADLVAVLEEAGVKDALITEQEGSGAFLIKTKELTEETHQSLVKAVTEKVGAFTELSFQSIGSVIGSELTKKAFWAFGINLFAIGLYIAYAFRKVSYPVASWKYALITIAALFHDAIIPVGLFAFLGHFMGTEIDTNLIVAILVVIGFSVHDTIVVFDRVRENLRVGKSGEDFGTLVNRSINETIARSINTSLTLIVVLVVLYFLGAASLQWFVLAMLVGTTAGTYSSIFVASPLLALWQGKK